MWTDPCGIRNIAPSRRRAGADDLCYGVEGSTQVSTRHGSPARVIRWEAEADTFKPQWAMGREDWEFPQSDLSDDESTYSSDYDSSSEGEASDSDSCDGDSTDDELSVVEGSVSQDFSDGDSSESDCSEDDSVEEDDDLDPTRYYHMRWDDDYAWNGSNRLAIDTKLPSRYGGTEHGARHATPDNVFSGKRGPASPSRLLPNQTTLDFLEIFCEMIMDIAPMLDI